MIELLTLGRVRLSAQGDGEGTGTPMQGKRLALLVYLAVAANGGGRRRDDPTRA